MREVISGMVFGMLVLTGLLFTFASATGPVELLLWLVIAVVSGMLVTKLLRLGRAES